MARTALEIKIEILENSIKEIGPTHLMSAVNVSWRPLHKYVEELKNNELIKEIELGHEERRKDKRAKIRYQATAKGINIIQTLKYAAKIVR